MNPPETTAPVPARHRWRWVAVAAFVAVLWAIVEFSGLRGQLSLQAVRETFARYPVGGFAAFAALFVLANVAHVPGAFFLAAAVLTLGPAWGALATYVAASIACMATFVVVRSLGDDALRAFGGRGAQRVFAQLDAHPVRSIVVLRLFFHSVPTLNYALALSGVRLRPYVLGTLAGLPLPIAVAALLFDTLAGWIGWTA